MTIDPLKPRNPIATNDPEVKQQLINLRLGWNLPSRYRKFRPDLTIDNKWGATTRGIMCKVGSGFLYLLTGIRGNGKTQIGGELMKMATNDLKRSAHYVTATRFFMKIKSSFKPSSEETEETVLDHYLRFDLLVIDEIGKQPELEWHNTLLFELINSRYGWEKDTLLIDNRTAEESEKAMGDSIVSRMEESGGIINCDWPSFRKQA